LRIYINLKEAAMVARRAGRLDTDHPGKKNGLPVVVPREAALGD
jgi:hypothetical protein